MSSNCEGSVVVRVLCLCAGCYQDLPRPDCQCEEYCRGSEPHGSQPGEIHHWNGDTIELGHLPGCEDEDGESTCGEEFAVVSRLLILCEPCRYVTT